MTDTRPIMSCLLKISISRKEVRGVPAAKPVEGVVKIFRPWGPPIFLMMSGKYLLCLCCCDSVGVIPCCFQRPDLGTVPGYQCRQMRTVFGLFRLSCLALGFPLPVPPHIGRPTSGTHPGSDGWLSLTFLTWLHSGIVSALLADDKKRKPPDVLDGFLVRVLFTP